MKRAAILVLVFAFSFSYAATVSVSDSAGFNAAVTAANSGDTLLLAADDYGSVTLNKTVTDYITITSADGKLGATFGQLTIQNSEYVRIDGVRAAVIRLDDVCSYIEVLNSNAGGETGTYDAVSVIRASAGTYSHIRIEGNYMHNAINGSQMFGVTDLVFKENRADSVSGDSYKFAGIIGGLIENNTGAWYYYPEPGAHHDFMQWQGGLSKDIIIRGNVSLIGPDGVSAQGIFGGNPTYENLLIENNIITTTHANGIMVSEGTGITVRNNTVLVFPGSRRTGISGPAGMVTENNVIGVGERTGLAGIEGTNYNLQHLDSTADYYYDDYYVNATRGPGTTIEDLRPVDGAPTVDQVGAYERIYELLGASGIYIFQPASTYIMDGRIRTGKARVLDIMGKVNSMTATGYYLEQSPEFGVRKVLYLGK